MDVLECCASDVCVCMCVHSCYITGRAAPGELRHGTGALVCVCKDPFQSRGSFLWMIFVLTCESKSVPYTPDGL